LASKGVEYSGPFDSKNERTVQNFENKKWNLKNKLERILQEDQIFYQLDLMYLTPKLSDDDASDINLSSEKIKMERHIRAPFPVKEVNKVNIKIEKKKKVKVKQPSDASEGKVENLTQRSNIKAIPLFDHQHKQL
jgi:hypothetical protein